MRATVIGAAALLCTAASAQQFVYPAKGQTPQQQQADEGQCHSWAVQQSKYDPAAPPPAAPTSPTGVQPGAGVRGAARGAVVGEIVADDAKTGAAVGAVAGRGQSRRQGAQQAQQQQNAGMTAYSNARAACLQGRGYTVK